MKSEPVSPGDPEKTPFVQFVNGTPLYPPPTLYESAQVLLERPRNLGPEAAADSLIQRGLVGGQFGVLPDSTWFALLKTFFAYESSSKEGTPDDWCNKCREALELMLVKPHASAWEGLKRLITNQIDHLSGWETSWRRADTERHKIFYGEDGRYYYRGEDAVLVQVIGAKTAEETRLDFITDQLVHSYGLLHRFLSLFALFAITDDYLSNPKNYPRSMRAIVPAMDFYHISHQWHFMFFDRTHSVVWRPNSNMCDPAWLVADVLASITEHMRIDFWRKRVESRRLDAAWIEPECKYQSDWVVDSSLSLGPEDEVFLTFEGRKFRWFNGTAERNAIVSMGLRNLRDHSEEEARLNRLLSALVWEEKVPVRKLWGTGGPRRPYPTAYGPRQFTGIVVDLAHVQYNLRAPRTDRQWFALALHKEAVNSRSRFYSFLCFWKIIDLAYPGAKDKREWMHNIAAGKTMEKDKLNEILKNTTDLEKYFREERRNALEHVLKRNTINPDDPKHEATIAHDLRVLEDFARTAITEILE